MSETDALEAVAGEHAEVLRLLLERGVDPDARQHQGWTALQAAAHRGRRDLVELLLGHGADSRLAADDGRTARDMALEKGHRELAERLAIG